MSNKQSAPAVDTVRPGVIPRIINSKGGLISGTSPLPKTCCWNHGLLEQSAPQSEKEFMWAYVLCIIAIATLIPAPSAIAQVTPAAPQTVEEAKPAPSVKALKAAEETARKSMFAVVPKGAAIQTRGGVTSLTLQDGSTREPNEAETALIDAYFQAKKAREEGEAEEMMAILSAEDRAELDAATKAISKTLPPRSRLYETDAGWRVALKDGTVREPQGAEAEALAQREAVMARLDAKIRDVLIGRNAPLRVLADPSLKDKTGAIDDSGVVLSQALVFNRAAVLKGDLAAKRDRFNAYTIPAGTRLFVVDGPEDQPAYCLPSKSKAGLFKMLSDWIPCFFDKDGDGVLETQTNGGKPLGGVYMYAAGFAPTGEVTQPAAFEPLPYLDGYQQRVGLQVDHMSANRKAGSHKFRIRAWVGADDTDRETLSDAPTVIEMKENTPTLVEMMGAKIEITATGKSMFSYRIVEPMPMQPYGLEMRTTTSTQFIYY